MSSASREFICSLLDRDPYKRLGAGPRDADELKSHKIFDGLDWKAVEDKTIEMPKITPRTDFEPNPKA